MSAAWLVLPTYNERENLEPMVRALADVCTESGLDANVLVVDDNSPDGTGEIADRLAEQDDRVHVLHRSEKNGLGGAYIAGFAWAKEHGYDVVVEMDADGSHQPEQLPRLLAALEHADLVLGSRWVAGGAVVNWPRSREILSRGGSAYARTLLRLPVQDATGGYRAYRREVLDALPLSTVASQGYCFQIDLAWQAWKQGWEVVEVPITFVERERGESKMNRSIVLEAVWRVAWWGLRSGRSRGVRPTSPARLPGGEA